VATIGSLAVNIVATTDKFIAGLNNASGRLGKFVKSVSTVQGALVGLAAGGFAAVVKGAIDAGGAIFDMSQKLKISTEALGALRFAAEQLGGTAGSVDTALAKMNVTLGNAISGSKAANDAFLMLGLQANVLAGIPVEQQFLAIVDAINRLPTAAEKASAAQKIFGRGAKELTALISAGTDKIVEFGEEAQRMGALVSNEQSKALDDAADSMAAFSAQWQAMTQQLVATFAPAITGAMFLITESIKFLKTVWNSLQVVMLGGLAAIEFALLNMVKVVNALLPKFLEFQGLEQDFRVGMESFVQQAKEIGNQVDIRHGFAQGQGPLQKSTAAGIESKQVEKNTATTNDKLDAVTAAIKASPRVQLKVAGVR
jgi:hypothetical protein